MNGTVLAATDGTPAARGALRLAHALAKEKGWSVQVLAVAEPVPVFDAGFMVALPEMEVYESRREALGREVAGQITEVTGNENPWPVSIQAGIPGTRIVQHAESLGADLIALGMGRHGPMDRVFGAETALQVVRVSHLPVLAVPESVEELPRSAVLGVDFSLFSRRAARASIQVLQSPWEVHFAHVLSGMEFLPTLSETWREDYEGEILSRLGEISREVGELQGGEVRHQVLEGEPAHELLSFAESKKAEMLAVGSHGHSFVGRLMMGSVSTRLLRSAEVPVLVVPPVERPEEVVSPEDQEETPATWVRKLDRFTREHAGRRTTLEVRDPEAGIQECGRGFPLWGVDYDPRKDRVDIMLGRQGTAEGHLTHSFPAPRAIEVERDEDGRALALRIELQRGVALLRIHPY